MSRRSMILVAVAVVCAFTLAAGAAIHADLPAKLAPKPRITTTTPKPGEVFCTYIPEAREVVCEVAR